MESYLTNRKQTAMVNKIRSTKQTVQQGVPQGSILGPLLYILYANDIEEIILKSKVTFYADDTVIYASSCNITSALKRVQKDLANLQTWCNKNGLFINPSKTKHMFFSNRKADYNKNRYILQINGTKVQQVPTYSYLGVALDEHLTFEAHSKQVINRVASKIYQLKKVRQFLNDKAVLLIY